MLPDLGKLRQVRILHDNSGSNPSWFLEKVREIFNRIKDKEDYVSYSFTRESPGSDSK